MVYLDWAASSPMYSEVIDLMGDYYLNYFANPSSIHSEGNKVKALLEKSRSLIAELLACKPIELIFTSGATESNNMMLFSLLNKPSRKINVIISAIEHPSIFEPAIFLKRFGIDVRIVSPNKSGLIDANVLEKMIDENTRLISIIYVNNEIGAIQPLNEISSAIRNSESKFGRKIIFHSDITQAAGKIPLKIRQIGLDAATLSAHKFGGPKGAGALFISEKINMNFLFKGGEQENGKRPGTENVVGIAGMALAFKKRNEFIVRDLKRAQNKYSYLIKELSKLQYCTIIPEERLYHPSNYSPYILSAAFSHLPGEVVVRYLSDMGIYISSGSACSSKKKDRTRVLLNLGLSNKKAESAVRVSMGWNTSENDIDQLIKGIKNLADLIPARRI